MGEAGVENRLKSGEAWEQVRGIEVALLWFSTVGPGVFTLALNHSSVKVLERVYRRPLADDGKKCVILWAFELGSLVFESYLRTSYWI